MKPFDFKCYKISSKLPLEKLETHFNLIKTLKKKDFCFIDKNQLDTILKYNAETKIVYLYIYGCICFVNFSENEIYTFLQYIDSIIGGIDYNLFSKYNESHIENNDYIYIICTILAKSVELSKLETDLEELYDKMDRLIIFLHSGKFLISKKLVLTVSKILRLEYHYANNIKIFDRNIHEVDDSESKEYFDKLSKHYELDERRKVIQNKMDDMRNIISVYSRFSYNHREARAYWLEVILLSLFPLAYLVELFLLHR